MVELKPLHFAVAFLILTNFETIPNVFINYEHLQIFFAMAKNMFFYLRSIRSHKNYELISKSCSFIAIYKEVQK